MYHQKTTQILFFLQLSYTTYTCSIINNIFLYKFCIYLGKSTTFSFRMLCGPADLFLALSYKIIILIVTDSQSIARVSVSIKEWDRSRTSIGMQLYDENVLLYRVSLVKYSTEYRYFGILVF